MDHGDGPDALAFSLARSSSQKVGVFPSFAQSWSRQQRTGETKRNAASGRSPAFGILSSVLAFLVRTSRKKPASKRLEQPEAVYPCAEARMEHETRAFDAGTRRTLGCDVHSTNSTRLIAMHIAETGGKEIREPLCGGRTTHGFARVPVGDGTWTRCTLHLKPAAAIFQ